ncbi:MAG TPA: sn-glycerol-3-phosphate ABC transporter ATP-binding protein UgpC [Candidatus Limnocylindrales bacterium]|nr:sn-glycerol-3-phosphate ABC transporter ATP-binding protein UgpC [Candidatus Limnocylindrales bacterium]
MATVAFDHVYKRYSPDVIAVNDLNIEIADGEFLVLVGPSGCGKTTALRCVAGLETISDGNLRIGDRVVNDVAPKDRDIAMVFQSYALYPHMSVYDNLAFGLKLRKTPKADIERRVKEAAGILGLDRFLDRKPKALSGGQRQRVALGRAIVREPSVFLMDEPLSNLDAKLRVQTRAEIARLHQRLGTTTVYVTHDQVEAMTMGDRIAVMKDGLLHQVGTPQELYDGPVNVFVAGFIGSPAMNFATVKAAEGEALMLGNAKLVLSGKAAAAVAARPPGADLLIGFRPEHLDVTDGRGEVVKIPATVDVVEYLGNEELIHAQAEGNEIVALIPSDRNVKSGQQIELSVPLDKLHVFDPETEKSLVA